MGPRLDSRGRLDLWLDPVDLVVLQWGRGWTAAEGPSDARPCASSRRFNGAAAGQPRKAKSSNLTGVLRAPLQWGRGWTAAEGNWAAASLTAQQTLQWGRGWTAAEGLGCVCGPGPRA